MRPRFDPATREPLHDPATPAEEIERAFAEWATLNRCLGAHRLVRRFLARWMNRGRVYRVLDLCTGAGDLPREMVRWARGREITLRIDAVDANAATLALARKQSGDFPEIHYECGDVLGPLPGDGYDLVHCAMSLHHFSDHDAARLLVRCRELSNRCVLVSDLERGLLTTAAIRVLSPFLRSPFLARAVRLSAQHAFSHGELRELAAAAGWPHFGHAHCLCCRQAVWLENRDLAGIPLDAAPGLA